MNEIENFFMFFARKCLPELAKFKNEVILMFHCVTLEQL